MHPHEQLIRTRYELLGCRDFDGLARQLHPDVTWHVPGRNPHAGVYVGREAVVAALRGVVEMSGGTSRVQPLALLVGDGHSAAVETGSAQLDGRSVEVRNVTLFRIEDDQVIEMWFLPAISMP